MVHASDQASATKPHTERMAGYAITTLRPKACFAEMAAQVQAGTMRKYFACANVHAIALAERQPRFKAALQAADWLTPDGVGVVLVSRARRGAIRQRLTGSDVFHGLSHALCETGSFRVFFLGSTEPTLRAIRERHEREFPRLTIMGTYSPPFATEFGPQETDAMVEAVNAARPDVLWVGMTAPKQELWIHENLHRLDVKFVGAVGAVFDFFAGSKPRPPLVFRRLGLEWMVRLVREPRRIWRRIFISGPRFAWLVLRSWSDLAHARSEIKDA